MSAPQPSSPEEHDPLDLTSLDADSLFTALGAVDLAIPDLLLSVKPVLAHLTSPTPERTAITANKAIEAYMSTLDKIQFILRQTVYYLRETRASTSALRPPPVGSIPTPFSASLPAGTGVGAGAGAKEKAAVAGGDESRAGGGEVELGLYGMRTEVRVMKDLEETLKRLREDLSGSQGLETRSGGPKNVAASQADITDR